MGCRNDYMNPTEREVESQLVSQLLQYLLKAAAEKGSLQKQQWVLDANISQQTIERINEGAWSQYGNASSLDADTALLCNLLKNIPEDTIVYDGHNADARKLADWWEKHQAADAKREAEEAADVDRAKIRATALSKLTPEEIEALEIK